VERVAVRVAESEELRAPVTLIVPGVLAVIGNKLEQPVGLLVAPVAIEKPGGA
jgi:hypothetical protein